MVFPFGQRGQSSRKNGLRGSDRFGLYGARACELLRFEQLESRQMLTAEVLFTFEVDNLSSQPISQVNPGDNFVLLVFVQDVRPTAQGVSQAYLDVSYNGALATLTANSVTHGPSYTFNPSDGADSSGSIQDIGGTETNSPAPPSPPDGQFLLFSAQFMAISSGQIQFTGSLTTNAAHPTLEVGGAGPLNSSQVRIVSNEISVNNQPPTLDMPSNATILEDSGLQTVMLTGISAGTNDVNQAVTITASSSNPSVIPNPTVTYTNGDSTGTLSFAPVGNANTSVGSPVTITLTVKDNGGTHNGAVDTITRTFQVDVTPVNDPPTLDAIADLSIPKNSGLQTVNLAGIGTGPADESAQTLSIAATSSNPAIVPNPTVNYSGGAAIGTLSFTPVFGASGTALITVTATDNGGTANGGVNTITRTFSVNLTTETPTLDPIADQSIPENAGPRTVNLTGIGARAGSGSGQIVTVTAVSSNPGLIPDPTVNYVNGATTGTLNFTPVANANGSATITVTVHDNGGTANGGVDTLTRTFVVNVAAVNGAPSLDAISDRNLLEDAGQQTVNLTGISAGPANESTQKVTITAVSSNPAIVPNPTIAYNSGDATGTLHFTPAANANGSVTITVTVQDNGGTAGGGVDTVTRTFTVNLAPVNDTPTLTPIPDQKVVASAGQQTINLSGISPGPSDEGTQTVTISATSSNPALVPNPTVNFTSGNATGSLNFTPVAGASGTTTITLTLHDSGGTANGGSDTLVRTFVIQVSPVNKVPTLDPIGDRNLLEDAGQQTVSLTGIGPGAADENNQTLTVTAVSSNPALIVNPTVNFANGASTGSLVFTPIANANGTATITVTVKDDGGTAGGGVDTLTRTFTVNVAAVNDAPTLDAIADVAVSQGATQHTVALTGISAGPADESGQAVTITATSSNPAIVPDPTVNFASGNATGALNFTPVAGATGSVTITVTAHDNGGAANGGSDTIVRTFTVNVAQVNAAPTLDPIADRSVLEDAGQQTVNLSGISAGAVNEAGQTITITATSSNPALIPNPTVTYTSGNATGTLNFTPAANASGSALITVTVHDSGGTANGGVDTLVRTFTVNLMPVNDAPTLAAIADQTLLEDAAQQSVTLTGISAGPSDESGQTVTITAVSSNPALIANPTVTFTSGNSTGTLHYTPAANANGTATITVTVTDNGGAANNGVNTFTRAFTANVTAVNDAPTLNAIPDQTVLEDAGQQTINLTGIGAGPSDESGQTLTIAAVSSNPALIANPTVTFTSGSSTGTLTFTPLANGTATITVTVMDNGGVANGGVNSTTRAFTVNVTAVNDAPTLDAIADRALPINAGQQTVNLTGVSAGPSNENGQTVTISAASSNTALIANPTVTFTSGSSTGTLTFTPVAGASGTAAITVTVKDNGGVANGGVDTTTRTFTVTVALGSLSGFAYVDLNGNGVKDASDPVLQNISVTLTGTVGQTAIAPRAVTTGSDGAYRFGDLAPGVYAITETQRASLMDGPESLGTLGGTVNNDSFTGITVASGQNGANYNFAERGVALNLITINLFLASTPDESTFFSSSTASAASLTAEPAARVAAQSATVSGLAGDVAQPMTASFLASAAQPAESLPAAPVADSVSSDNAAASNPLAPAVYLAQQNQSSAANQSTGGGVVASNDNGSSSNATNNSAARADAMSALLVAPTSSGMADTATPHSLTTDGVDQALAGESDWKGI